MERIKRSASDLNDRLERAFFAIILESDGDEHAMDTTDLRALLTGWVAGYEPPVATTIIVRHDHRPLGSLFAYVDAQLVCSALSVAAGMVAESGDGDDDLELFLDAHAGQITLSIKAVGWEHTEAGGGDEALVQPHQHPLGSLNLDKIIVEKVMNKHRGYVNTYVDSKYRLNMNLIFLVIYSEKQSATGAKEISPPRQPMASLSR